MHQEPRSARGSSSTSRSCACRRLLLLAVGLATSVAIAACSSGRHAVSPTTTSDASSTTVSTDASQSTTTVLGPSGPQVGYPAAQPNPPSLAGAYPKGSTVDLVTVIKTLTTYEDWVWSHPNPALVANYELPTGTAYAGEVKNLSMFASRDLHASPTPAEIDWVKITQAAKPQPPGPDGIPRTLAGHQWFVGGIITAVYNLKPIPMLNADDQPSGQSFNPQQVGPAAYVISLVQGPDGQFRIDDITQLHPAGGAASLEGGQ